MDGSWNEIIKNYDRYDKYEKYAKMSLNSILYNIENMRETIKATREIYPKQNDIFRAFKLCNFNDLKVVIIGQDPYHNPNQATGLAFGVNNELIKNRSIKIPPSLNNISKELKNDLNIELQDYSLEKWAKQGVLLLNSALTVIEGSPGSQMRLWNEFTDYIISCINKLDNIIFVAWGAYAYNKLKNVNKSKNYIIITSHPSSLSCYRPYGIYPPFTGSRPFSQINNILKKIGKKEIEW